VNTAAGTDAGAVADDAAEGVRDRATDTAANHAPDRATDTATNAAPDRSTDAAADKDAGNPFANLAPQAKLVAAVIMVVGIVLGAPRTPFEVLAIASLVVLLGVVAQASLGRMLPRSLIVLPVAGSMALLLPLRFVSQWDVAGVVQAYATGWPQAAVLLITPWLCTLVMMFLVEICPQKDMLYAFERLRVPHIFVLLLTFMYRYVDVMRAQLTAARRSLVSRAPTLTPRRQVLLYGNLAGAMVIRAYGRGERVYAAMLSRGFTGVLPRPHTLRMTAPDAALIVGALLLAAALILYR
jgi:cobalt/nickel transport system permease protein